MSKDTSSTDDARVFTPLEAGTEGTLDELQANNWETIDWGEGPTMDVVYKLMRHNERYAFVGVNDYGTQSFEVYETTPALRTDVQYLFDDDLGGRTFDASHVDGFDDDLVETVQETYERVTHSALYDALTEDEWDESVRLTVSGTSFAVQFTDPWTAYTLKDELLSDLCAAGVEMTVAVEMATDLMGPFTVAGVFDTPVEALLDFSGDFDE